jgi:SprB repeat/Secretion system C-terminal sorting domain
MKNLILLTTMLFLFYQTAKGQIHVSSLGNSGSGTLRAAIESANANPGQDIIDFTISGTISISTTLPILLSDVTINGGASASPTVKIQYTSTTGNEFKFRGSNITIRALEFDNTALIADTMASNILIEKNIIKNVAAGLTLCNTKYSTTNNIVVDNNNFVDCVQSAVHSINNKSWDGLFIRNNTINSTSDHVGIAVWTENTGDSEFKNIIIEKNEITGKYYVAINTQNHLAVSTARINFLSVISNTLSINRNNSTDRAVGICWYSNTGVCKNINIKKNMIDCNNKPGDAISLYNVIEDVLIDENTIKNTDIGILLSPDLLGSIKNVQIGALSKNIFSNIHIAAIDTKDPRNNKIKIYEKNEYICNEHEIFSNTKDTILSAYPNAVQVKSFINNGVATSGLVEVFKVIECPNKANQQQSNIFIGSSISPINGLWTVTPTATIMAGDKLTALFTPDFNSTASGGLNTSSFSKYKTTCANTTTQGYTTIVCQNSSLTLNTNNFVGSTYSYSWSGPNSFSSNMKEINVNTNISGSYNYSVTVSDGECVIAVLTYALTVTPTLSVSSTTVTHVSCFGYQNGAINMSFSGGNGIYGYVWQNNTNNSSSSTNLGNLSSLKAGSYGITITSGSCITTASAAITEPDALITSATSTNVSCYAGNNGVATITATGGTTPYSYTWSNGQTSPMQTSLSAGTYTVTVSDSKSCSSTSSVTITQPIALTISVAVTNVSCNGGNNGVATITATGGTTPYSYTWSNGQTSPMQTSLSAGTYTVTVSDSKSCSSTSSITITQPIALTISVAVTNIKCMGLLDGKILINPSGGTPPYQYSKDDGSTYQVSDVFDKLAVGTYKLKVKDKNGCFIGSTAVVTQSLLLSIGTPISKETCSGASTGSIKIINPSGGTPPYQYSKDGGNYQNSNIFYGLSVGTYRVQVEDANGCTSFNDNIITEYPKITGKLSTVPIPCNGQGSVTFTPTVTFPLTYLWSNNETQATMYTSTAGPYNVIVKDHNNCTITDGTMVSSNTNPPSAVISASVTKITCAKPNSVLSAPSGGSSYQWSGPVGSASFLPNNSITVTQGGTYFLTVTASNNCTATNSITITVDKNTPNATIESTPANAKICYNKFVELKTSNVGSTYVYQWAGIFNSTNNSNEMISAYLTSNTQFQVTVTNTSNGCSATAIKDITVNQLRSVSISSTPTNATITCTNPVVTLTAIPDKGTSSSPITYSWTGPTELFNQPLPPQEYRASCFPCNNPTTNQQYTVTATSDACSVAATQMIAVNKTKPQVPTLTDVTICANGSLPIQPTAPIGYTYTWNPSSFSNTNSQIYKLTVTNAANGCTANKDLSITVLPEITITNTNSPIIAGFCLNPFPDTIIKPGAVHGTTLPLSHSWSLNGIIKSIGGSFKPKEEGIYTYTVKYTNFSCSAKSQDYKVVNSPIITTQVSSSGTCPFTLTVSPPCPSCTYQWRHRLDCNSGAWMSVSSPNGNSSTYTAIMNGEYMCSVTNSTTNTSCPSYIGDNVCIDNCTTIIPLSNDDTVDNSYVENQSKKALENTDPLKRLDDIVLEVAPNPMSNKLIVRYYLPDGQNIRISMVNLNGSKISLLNTFKESGSHTEVFLDPIANLPTGIYLLSLEAPNLVLSKKLIKIE